MLFSIISLKFSFYIQKIYRIMSSPKGSTQTNFKSIMYRQLPEWVIDPLTSSLKSLFQMDISEKDRFSLGFKSGPIYKTTRKYRGVKGSPITTELRTLLEKDQNRLQLLKSDLESKGKLSAIESESLNIMTQDPRSYHLSPQLPAAIRDLLLYYYWRVRLPPDVSCNIKVGLFARQAKMTIKPPSKESKTMCRIVVHLGPTEVYKLTKLTKSGKFASSEEEVMENGSYLVLDKTQLFEHNIFVSGNPRVKFPLPSNYDELVEQGLSAVGSSNKKAKMPTPDHVKQMVEQSGMIKQTIRGRHYRRLTIILDCDPSALVPDDQLLQIISYDDTDKSTPETPVPEEMMGKLPAGLDPSILGKVANDKKLVGLVSEVAMGVKSDLEKRTDLEADDPQITPELIGAIAESATRRISPDKVRGLSSNVESILSDLNPNEKRSSRKTRRKPRNNSSKGSLNDLDQEDLL